MAKKIVGAIDLVLNFIAGLVKSVVLFAFVAALLAVGLIISLITLVTYIVK